MTRKSSKKEWSLSTAIGEEEYRRIQERAKSWGESFDKVQRKMEKIPRKVLQEKARDK